MLFKHICPNRKFVIIVSMLDLICNFKPNTHTFPLETTNLIVILLTECTLEDCFDLTALYCQSYMYDVILLYVNLKTCKFKISNKPHVMYQN